MRSEINDLFWGLSYVVFLSSAGKELRRLKTMKNEMRSEITYVFWLSLEECLHAEPTILLAPYLGKHSY